MNDDRRPASSAATPWLSVIMPAYRGEQWLGAALESIACENTAGIEVLVIDSSPTTATLAIAEKFAHRLHLRLFRRPEFDSWHVKTNFGVEVAAAAHLCWLGVDDLWLLGRAAGVRRWIDAAPHAALHLAPSAIVGASGRKLGVWRCPLPAEAEIPRATLLERLLVQNFIAAPAPVFRKDAWIACGGLDPTLWYTADWDLWLKLAARGPSYYHEAVTIGFRIHGGSLTSTGSRDAGDIARQMHTVLDRHSPALQGDAAAVLPVARASIAVNAALAAAAQGDYAALGTAAAAVLRLGPRGMRRYFRDSRIRERVLPRVRAKLAGAL